MRTQNGTLTKKAGAWLGHYSRWVQDTTGEKTRLQKCFRIGSVEEMTKTVARQKLRERIEQEMGLRSDSRVTLVWFIDNRWKPLHESTWRDSTKSVNEFFLSLITGKFGNTALEESDPVDLQIWLNGLAKSHSGSLVRHVRTLLRSIFNEAVEQDYLRKSPARLIRIPANLKPVIKTFLEQDQIKALLGVATGMHRLLLRLLLTTGLRPSELFALEWNSLDPEKKLLHISQSIYRGKLRPYTKTTDGNSRQSLKIVFLPDAIVSELKAWKAEAPHSHEEDYIFATEYGMAWWKENYQHRILNPLKCRAFHDGKCFDNGGTRCKSKATPKVNFQVLRRTVATHAQRLGSPKDIAAILRHTKPDMAALEYTQQQDEGVRSAVEKLEALIT
jgi:integrase